jgi:sulfatase maturation enzyme AslB (radical SAM superfamily)
MNQRSPIICLTAACNHRCLFCSRAGYLRADRPAKIRRLLAAGPRDVCLEGGEPMLAKDLPRWAAYARKKGVRDIILVTNGFGLYDRKKVLGLLKAGVTMFNVNLPAHTEKLFDLLTQTNGNFKRTVSAIGTLIAEAGPRAVRATFVINSANYKYLPDYAAFVVRAFPGLFYTEFNMVKELGAVTARNWLIPRLSAVQGPLLKACRVLSRAGRLFMVEGVPLCLMPGFEPHNIDTRLLVLAGTLSDTQKTHAEPCSGCSLKGLCAGPRKDYLELHGGSELKPSKKTPQSIISATRKKWLTGLAR